MSAWSTPTDLVSRFDIDVIGDLMTDDRVRLSRSDIIGHANLAVLLDDSKGEILAALRANDRYQVDQLDDLTGAAASHLKRVQCTIAMALAFERRPGIHEDVGEKVAERADEWLIKLKQGQNIFALPEIVKAGNPTYGGLQSVEVTNRNLLPDRMTRYFPGPHTRLPLNRG